MRYQIVFFVLFILLVSNIRATNAIDLTFEEYQTIVEYQTQAKKFENVVDLSLQRTEDDFSMDSITTVNVKFKRGKAVIFTLLTGLFGGHRIYLGTHQRTPILYSITFGGLGVLPIIDLVHIIFTKDLSRFENKSQVIMWGK